MVIENGDGQHFIIQLEIVSVCACGKSQVHLIQSVSVCHQACEKKINTSGNLKEFGSMSSGVAIVYNIYI